MPESRKGLAMPKETVHWGKQYVARQHKETENTGAWVEDLAYEGHLEGETWPETDTLVRSPKVEIFWDRPDKNHLPVDEDDDGFVQIGMVIDEFEFQQRAKETNGDDSIRARGFYTKKLTRTQINEMIRVLKRARNAAYGADE